MIRRAGLPRRPAGPAGSDGETTRELAIGLVSPSDSGPDAPLPRRPPNVRVRRATS